MVLFQAILVAGQTQANVCPKYYSASVLANITVSFKVYGVNCQTYLGVTSICFAPPATETRTCAELATDLTFSRVSCTDQVALTARLVSFKTYQLVYLLTCPGLEIIRKFMMKFSFCKSKQLWRTIYFSVELVKMFFYVATSHGRSLVYWLHTDIFLSGINVTYINSFTHMCMSPVSPIF